MRIWSSSSTKRSSARALQTDAMRPQVSASEGLNMVVILAGTNVRGGAEIGPEARFRQLKRIAFARQSGGRTQINRNRGHKFNRETARGGIEYLTALIDMP